MPSFSAEQDKRHFGRRSALHTSSRSIRRGEFHPPGRSRTPSKSTKRELRSLDEAVRRCERLTGLDGILGGVRAETVAVTDPVAALELAAFAQQDKKWPHTAVKLAEKAFASNLKLADDLSAGHRLTAARAAAAASSGRGGDAERLDAVEKTRLRKLALGWLRADLEVWKPRAAARSDRPATPSRNSSTGCATPTSRVCATRTPWKNFPRKSKEWSALWAEVEVLINLRAEGASSTCRRRLCGGLGIEKALFSDDPFSLLLINQPLRPSSW